MASIIEICNTALIELGAETISSLSETSTEAVSCNTVWEQCRKSVLRSHPWNFATKTEELPAITVNTRKFRYDYAYQLPSNCLRLMRVYKNGDYKLEANVIYTNKSDCFVKYIYDNISTNTWDSLFIDAMAAKVQSKIAFAITKGRDNVTYAENLYEKRLMLAQAVDASEDIEDVIDGDNALVQVRY